MRLTRSLLLIAFVVVAEAARQKSRDSTEDDDSSEEESDAEWENVACSVYDSCLQEYDERMSDCGHGKGDEADEDDTCYEPIEKYFHSLLDKKERRNQLLRKCYNTGQVDKASKKKEKRTKEENTTSGSIGKRHRGSCRQKFGELEQFLSGKKKKNGTNGNGGTKHPAAQPMGAESCHASAKRLKERCQKIESCCPRVKSCRTKIASHTLSEEMRELETKIREERRMCREKEFLR